MSDSERIYCTEQSDTKPNNSLANTMLWAIAVVAICWILNELGAYRVDKNQMRVGAVVALIFLIIPQYFRIGNGMEKPSTKYFMLACTVIVMFIVNTVMMFHATLCMILPMLMSTFYKSKKLGLYSIAGSLLISVFAPIVSFVMGLWDSLFLQVLLQFCGFDSFLADTPFFTTFQSVLQIILYIVIPRSLLVLLVGFGTLRIISENADGLSDRIELMRTNSRMKALEEDTLECLATIIESRDGSTGTHVINTKKYISAMVNYMVRNGMYAETVDRKFADDVIRASILHDIGKVAIPDNILNKPGAFTNEEYEIMKTHCIEGDKIVSKAFADNPDADFVKITRDIVSFHHEKVNGKGYPYGLEGTGIPLSARMMAIVDAFDAITSKRVYKTEKSVEEALEILRKDSGTHFDPDLVEIFISAYAESFDSENK